MIHDVDGIAALAVYRVIKGDRLHDGFQRLRDGARLLSQLLGDVLYGRFLQHGFGELLPCVQRPIGKVSCTAAYAEHVVIPEIPPDFSDDHRNGIGAEFDADTGIEIVDRFDESDTAHLKQIVRIVSASGKALDDAEHQSEIAVDELRSRVLVTVLGFIQKVVFFFTGKRF